VALLLDAEAEASTQQAAAREQKQQQQQAEAALTTTATTGTTATTWYSLTAYAEARRTNGDGSVYVSYQCKDLPTWVKPSTP